MLRTIFSGGIWIAALAAGGLAIAAGAAAAEFRVEEFQPEKIEITLGDLPEPYATDSAQNHPKVVPMPDDAVLQAPPGFSVNVFADGLEMPRWLAVTPEGDILLAESRQNRIKRLRDTDGDGAADSVTVLAAEDDGLNIPFGMAFAKGSIFVGNTDAVVRYPWPPEGDTLSGPPETITELPGGGYNQHWTRNVIASPDEEFLFVSVGSKSNADAEDPPRASVLRMRPDGSDRIVYGYGLRNPVGLDIHPDTGELYTTVNERDGLGDNLVPDYLTAVKEGGFYGWPFAYLAPRFLDPRHADDGESARPELAGKTLTPDVLFESHSAALGLVFGAESENFPDRYRQGAFVAFRGSWNRDRGTGYKLVFVPFDGDRPAGGYEDFVTGFLLDPSVPQTWGRPVGVIIAPDGSLLFTEEMNGRIFRVSYSGGDR